MTSTFRKRRYAGPPASDLRKIDKSPAHIPPHKKQRTYVLRVSTTTTSQYEETYKYPTRAAREQAKAAMLKKDRDAEKRRTWRHGGHGHASKTTRAFEEFETGDE